MYCAYQILCTLKVPGTRFASCAWEGSGLRLALAVDSFVYFANVRAPYIRTAFVDCIVYAFSSQEFTSQISVAFWNIKTNEVGAKLGRSRITLVHNDVIILVYK